MTLEARTTLLNVDLEELRDGESIFFEDTWMAAYKKVHAEDENDKKVEIRSVVVEDTSDDKHGGGKRQLCAAGAQLSLFWFYTTPNVYFDIWTFIELTCFLCNKDNNKDEGLGIDDDDDVYGYANNSGGRMRKLKIKI